MQKLKATALLLAPSLALLASHAEAEGCFQPEKLNFRADGTFKVMQITDPQDDHCTEKRTVELITKALEQENPDLVVFSGDIITGGDRSPEETRIAINNMVAPIEAAGVPFMITFGNHDEDSSEITGLYEPDQLEIYRGYSCNINEPDYEDRVTGTGEMVTLVRGSFDRNPKLAVWGLDSGRYAPNPIAGQDINQEPVKYDNKWDWIREDQVNWYVEKSKNIEKRYGKKIPGMMFFHIPLPEHEYMWDVDKGYEYPDHMLVGKQPGKHEIQGERNECVCTGPFNSGLFGAMVERGDIKTVFVGHDHINNYQGNYYGIQLGYGASSGFGPYGFEGDERNRLRGVRIFEVSEANPEKISTHMLLASELGINTDDPKKYNDYPPEICGENASDEPVTGDISHIIGDRWKLPEHRDRQWWHRYLPPHWWDIMRRSTAVASSEMERKDDGRAVGTIER